MDLLNHLKPCPFCGNDINKQDPLDTIYPMGRETNIYEIVCQQSAGGCDAMILGGSIEECIKKWNRRINE